MKQIRVIVVVLILAVAALGAWKLLGTKKPVTAAAEEAHGAEKKDEHGDGGKDEHGAEGRVELTAAQLKNSEIVIEEAGPAKLRTKLRVFGKISPNEERLAHVMPRYPGIVRRVGKRLGDTVLKDDVLAVVQSNESLQEYEIKSDIAGTVVQKDGRRVRLPLRRKRTFLRFDRPHVNLTKSRWCSEPPSCSWVKTAARSRCAWMKR